jgi:ribosomal protein L11 methyltransferase
MADLLSGLEPVAASAVSVFRNAEGKDWLVEAYLEGEFDPSTLPDLATSVRLEDVADENWVAISQAALPPVRAGRFLVHGSHDRELVRGRSRFTIEIDAGEAFGTAHHASTRSCLTALDRLIRERRFKRVLDLGCGSGVLAIAAARALPAGRIEASDIDRRAVEVARANARINGVGRRVSPSVRAGLRKDIFRGGKRLDLVLANIVAEPLIALAKPLAAAVTPDGYVVLGGFLEAEARKVEAAYVAAGFTRRMHLKSEDWATLVLRRR